ncbi:hypothetical protein HSIEG1_1496 [Enterococcus sp. HSIEG1]|nr:hypothetical protein HSIEG1_1496 [Enterococcus sp. HSIEG1]
MERQLASKGPIILIRWLDYFIAKLGKIASRPKASKKANRNS